MNIEDYADAINATLVIMRHHNENNRYSAKFEYAQIDGGNTLSNVFGTGTCAHDAVESYIKQICGKTLVITNGDGSTRQFTVPKKIFNVYDGSH